MASPLIEAATEPGDIFVDPSIGAADRDQIREMQGNIDQHLAALQALKVHPINGIEHGAFMLLLEAVRQAYDLRSADDSDNPNDPIVRANRGSMEALRYIHSFLYPDIACPCDDQPGDCEHLQYDTATGKCLNCPGYATIDGKPASVSGGGCRGCGAIQDCTPDCSEANNIVPIRPDERQRILVYAYREVYNLKTWAVTHGLGHLEDRYLTLQRKLQDLANTAEIAGPLDEAITIARFEQHGICAVCTGPARFTVHTPHESHHHTSLFCGSCLTLKLRALRRVVTELAAEALRGIDGNLTYYRMCDIALSPQLEVTNEKIDTEERKAWQRVRELLADNVPSVTPA